MKESDRLGLKKCKEGQVNAGFREPGKNDGIRGERESKE